MNKLLRQYFSDNLLGEEGTYYYDKEGDEIPKEEVEEAREMDEELFYTKAIKQVLLKGCKFWQHISYTKDEYDEMFEKCTDYEDYKRF